MKTVHMLGTLKQLKAVTDPLRLRILDAFVHQSATTKQVATLLGENPTKLYHHVQILEEAGLIRLVKKRENRGIVERYYRAVAEGFMVDRAVLERTKGARPATRGYETLLLSAMEAALSDARKTVAAGLIQPVGQGQNALVCRHQFHGSEAAINRLMERVRAWIAECQEFDGGEGDLQFGLTIAFFPIGKKPRSRAPRGKSTGKKRGKRKPKE
jgi:DNA-binding transcriptional ArsR family regulator